MDTIREPEADHPIVPRSSTLSSATTPPGPLIIFLHIPKTGGVTLHGIVRRQYPPARVSTTHLHEATTARLHQFGQALPRDTAVVQGHMHFGLHQFLARGCTYITLLREPIDRLLSQYHMILHNPKAADHGVVRSGRISLKDYAWNSQYPNDNQQTRLLSGHGFALGPCPEPMLEVARHNLREHFSVVGLTERFDETLILLRRTFRWRFVFYARQNVSQNRPDKASVDGDTLSVIEDANRLDLELYDYARAMFQEQLSRQRPDFGIEREAFKRVNGLVGERSLPGILS